MFRTIFVMCDLWEQRPTWNWRKLSPNQQFNHRSGLVYDFHAPKKHVLFLYFNRFVYFEFLPQSQIVDRAYYKVILQLLRELWRDKSWSIHRDNAPTNFQFCAKSQITVPISLPTFQTWFSVIFPYSGNWNHCTCKLYNKNKKTKFRYFVNRPCIPHCTGYINIFSRYNFFNKFFYLNRNIHRFAVLMISNPLLALSGLSLNTLIRTYKMN